MGVMVPLPCLQVFLRAAKIVTSRVPLWAHSSSLLFVFMLRRLSYCVLCMLPVFQLLAQSCATPTDSMTDSYSDFWRQ